MAVTKRTRYEAMRRDNFTCRYCRSTEGELTVDHVTPVALGGSDKPDNLVACCKDCNAGKASASPDATLVADVSEDAVRWTRAIAAVAKAKAHARQRRAEYVHQFQDAWSEWGYGHGRQTEIPRASDWEAAIRKFYELDLPIEELEDAVAIACSNQRIPAEETWRYFCGVCWRKLEDLHDEARAAVMRDGA